MKIAIVGDPIRKEKDEGLVKAAKKYFEKVIYCPIDRVRFEIKGKMEVSYDGERISDYECIFPVPTNRNREMFYTLVRMLNHKVLPFSPSQYLLLSTNQIFQILKTSGIEVREHYSLFSTAGLESIKEKFEFPLIVKQLHKKVLVTNEKTLKQVISVMEKGFPIIIYKPIKPDFSVFGLTIGNEAFYYKRKEGNVLKDFSKSEKKIIEKNLRKIKKVTDLDYFAFRFIKHNNKFILDWLSFSPNFPVMRKNLGIKLEERIMKFMKEKSETTFIKIFSLIRKVLKK